MSTRCNIHFINSYEDANVYRHSDGYPDGKHGVPETLKRFFQKVQKECADTMYGTRFDDPSYLAAKFIVYQADIYRSKNKSKLDFGSLGIMKKNAPDAAYIYKVNCDLLDPKTGFPTVTWNKT